MLTHLRKDLQLEWRARELINGMLFFALLVVVVFSLAFDPTAYPTVTRQISGGLLWVGLLFASMTALNQSWARETAQPGAGCAAAVACAGVGAVSGQGAGELHLCELH